MRVPTAEQINVTVPKHQPSQPRRRQPFQHSAHCHLSSISLSFGLAFSLTAISYTIWAPKIHLFCSCFLSCFLVRKNNIHFTLICRYIVYLDILNLFTPLYHPARHSLWLINLSRGFLRLIFVFDTEREAMWKRTKSELSLQQMLPTDSLRNSVPCLYQEYLDRPMVSLFCLELRTFPTHRLYFARRCDLKHTFHFSQYRFQISKWLWTFCLSIIQTRQMINRNYSKYQFLLVETFVCQNRKASEEKFELDSNSEKIIRDVRQGSKLRLPQLKERRSSRAILNRNSH